MEAIILQTKQLQSLWILVAVEIWKWVHTFRIDQKSYVKNDFHQKYNSGKCAPISFFRSFCESFGTFPLETF